MKFLKNQDGATAIEYGLIACLIVIFSILAMDKMEPEKPLALEEEAPAADIAPPG